VPLYAGALVLLVKYFGVEGAAVAWALRMLFDTACLKLLSKEAA
jgi:hypothetical protein